MLLLLNKDH